MAEQVVLHLAAPAFTARLVAPESKALRSLGKAFAKAFARKYPGLALGTFELRVGDGAPLADGATVGDLGAARAVRVVPTRAPGAATEHGVVVALMASHVNGAGRLASLGDCLASIAAQRVLPDAFVASYSAAAPELGAAAAAVFARGGAVLRLLGVDVRVVAADGPRAQFRHYAEMLPLLEDLKGEAWCVLTDDDDVWHRDRVAAYDAAFGGLSADCDAVASPVYALNVRDLAAGAPIEASALRTVVSPTNQPSKPPRESQTARSNAVDVAARVSLWREYFETASEDEHLSVFADNHWLSWLYARNSSLPTVAVPDGNWMYLWRQDHSTAQHVQYMAAAHAPVVRAGLARALGDARVFSSLRANAPGGRGPGVTAEAAVAVFARDVTAAERTLELSRVWFYHGRYAIADVDAYLDVLEAPGDHGDADPDVKALLFPADRAASRAAAARVDALRTARPDLDLDADDRRTRAFLREYARRRLIALAERRFAYRPLATEDVAAAFAAATVDGFAEPREDPDLLYL